MRLLEKDPAKRPRTADRSRALARRSVGGERHVRRRPSMPRQQQPRRVLWALAGAGILASMAAGGAWFTNRHAGEHADAVTGAAPATSARRDHSQIDRGDAARQHQPRHERRLLRRGNDRRGDERAEPHSGPARGVGQRGRRRTTVSANPADIGKALNVNMVLFGTVQRDKTRLRVTARLVNTADGITVWSDMFERDSKDVFKVQDDISNAIVAAISPELTSAGGRCCRRSRRPSPVPGEPRHERSPGVRSLPARPLLLRQARRSGAAPRAGLFRAGGAEGLDASRAPTPESPTSTRCCRSTRTCASTR